jgi:putative FmdB family regulatory protein
MEYTHSRNECLSEFKVRYIEMALYVYRCAECGNEFEVRQPMTADALVDCFECKSPTLLRVMFGNIAPSATPTRSSGRL